MSWWGGGSLIYLWSLDLSLSFSPSLFLLFPPFFLLFSLLFSLNLACTCMFPKPKRRRSCVLRWFVLRFFDLTRFDTTWSEVLPLWIRDENYWRGKRLIIVDNKGTQSALWEKSFRGYHSETQTHHHQPSLRSSIFVLCKLHWISCWMLPNTRIPPYKQID